LGSKLKNTEQLGIKVISEDEFEKMVGRWITNVLQLHAEQDLTD